MFNNNRWLEQVSEAVIDPERDILDPHHHLWPQSSMGYNLHELLADTSDGHAVSQTVFVECGAAYRREGPDFLRCVGETEFVAQAARIARERKAPTQIAGIVAHADLRSDQLDAVLDAHDEAAEGLLELEQRRHNLVHDFVVAIHRKTHSLELCTSVLKVLNALNNGLFLRK